MTTFASDIFGRSLLSPLLVGPWLFGMIESGLPKDEHKQLPFAVSSTFNDDRSMMGCDETFQSCCVPFCCRWMVAAAISVGLITLVAETAVVAGLKPTQLFIP